MEIILLLFVIAASAANFETCHAQEDLPYSQFCKRIEDLPIHRDWDDFSTPELITAHGFPSETHEVPTVDGYSLTIHRMANPGYQPVFILHGLLCTSEDFFNQRGNNSIGAVLYNGRYDIWLGNMRGNGYSVKHQTLGIDSPKFWNFSCDEIAKVDVPTMVNYVSTKTGIIPHCIGNSLGSMVIMASLTINPNLCKSFIGLAPVGEPRHADAPLLKAIANLENPEEPMRMTMRAADPSGRFSPKVVDLLMSKSFPHLCNPEVDRPAFCQDVGQAIMGSVDPEEVDQEMGGRIYSFFPAWSSQKVVIQATYGIGRDVPMAEYRYQFALTDPPVYNLSKITLPICFFVGANDRVARESDVRRWSTKLGVIPEIKLVGTSAGPKKKFSHMDFLWAKHVCSYVHGPVLDQLNKYDGRS